MANSPNQRLLENLYTEVFFGMAKLQEQVEKLASKIDNLTVENKKLSQILLQQKGKNHNRFRRDEASRIRTQSLTTRNQELDNEDATKETNQKHQRVRRSVSVKQNRKSSKSN